MRLVADVKLLLSPEQKQALLETLERANQACDALSQIAWQERIFNRHRLQKQAYQPIRKQFELPAQLCIRAIAKVCDAYGKDRDRLRTFHPHGAIAYDDRILTWWWEKGTVSIATLSGRIKVPFQAGAKQRELLTYRKGETDLVYRDGEFYLLAGCEVPEPELRDSPEALGVDLGIINLAVDSDGEVFSGQHLRNLRHRHRRLRTKLQKKGSRAARRLLKKRRRKERRMAQHVNHCVSQRIVAKAEGTGRAIALEDLQGIRERVPLKRRQRAAFHSWSFHDLQSKILYKARRVGVPVRMVDARNTSRTCPHCEHVDQANRRSQSQFQCQSCGYAALADWVAACNIAGRGAVNHPDSPGLRA